MIVIKAVLDSRTVTQMESELQNSLLDTSSSSSSSSSSGPDHGLEPDIFW